MIYSNKKERTEMNNLKKKIGLTVASVLTMVLLSGCSLVETIFPQARGIILYGTDQKVNEDMNKYKDDVKSSELLKVKMTESNDQKVMLINQTTAEAMLKGKLMRKVTDKDKVEPITALPKIAADAPALFAKEEMNKVNLNGKEIPVKYEGNIILGDARRYADMFMIVSDNAWEKMDGTETAVGVLHFDKKNPENEIGNFTAEKAQLFSVK
jgi:Uncharacterised lipoprotein family